jgi:hypothetical protein
MNATIGLRPALATFIVLLTLGVVAGAQDNSTLRRDIERRFDVLPLQNGLVLRPKNRARQVRSVELSGGTIAIDGREVTGAEARERLGPDADAVIRLSYLDAEAQRRLFGTGSEAAQPARPAEPATPATEARPARARRSGDRVRFGGSVTVGRDEVIDGDVVAIGGSASVDGEVTGDVVSIGGSVDLGPTADVRKDVTVIGGMLRRDDGARVGGEVKEIGVFGGERFRRGRFVWPGMFSWGFGSVFALMSTIARLAILSLLVCLTLLVGRDYVERVGARAAAEPLKAGLVGFCAQLLLLPLLIVVIVVLVITIIGIPLLALIPFALLALALVFLVGFTAVAHHVGALASGRLGWTRENPYLTTILGIVVILSPVLIARLIGLAGIFVFPLTAVLVAAGLGLEYVVWTVGLGAVALMRFEKKSA